MKLSEIRTYWDLVKELSSTKILEQSDKIPPDNITIMTWKLSKQVTMSVKIAPETRFESYAAPILEIISHTEGWSISFMSDRTSIYSCEIRAQSSLWEEDHVWIGEKISTIIKHIFENIDFVSPKFAAPIWEIYEE